MNKDAVILIPCYNPNIEIMDSFIEELESNYENIVFINDGCNSKYDNYFKKLEKKHHVLKHYKNLGKGRGIKNGFNYILNNFPSCKAIITADCDGQHAIEDITKCYKKVIKNPNALVLGCRDFNSKNVPFKSRYGNKITRLIFKLFIGLNITDTQTGLRGFSLDIASKFLDINGERYEYETNVLIACKNKDIEIVEVPIKTIYINDNKTSHFNPLKDSILIYKLFIKYILGSLSSFVVDILLFSFFIYLFSMTKIPKVIILSTIIARILSSFYNYFINAKLVFKKMNKKSIFKYFILVFVQMWVSAFTVSIISSNLKINPIPLKIIVDSFIFVINFIVQRELIFKK